MQMNIKWLLMLVLLAPLARAQDDDETITAGASINEPSCFGDKIRISALISTGDKVKVGIVETASKASYLVSPGERAGDVEVLDVDYERETVTLRLGQEICTLNLASDPDAVYYAQEEAPATEEVYRGEAIEQYIRDNPDAMQKGMIKFPLPMMPDAVGKGESIERFLRENPEMAAKVDEPAVGKGEGIESFLKAHPEINADQEIPEGSFGPGIDEQLRLHPEMWTNIPPDVMEPENPDPESMEEEPTEDSTEM